MHDEQSAPTQAVEACIALGANLGDREGAIHTAIAALAATPDVEVLRVSAIHETDAVTLPGADPQPTYCNAAAVVRTTLSAADLLDVMLEIERTLGRDRAGRARWTSRTIDLDLVFYADSVIEERGLTVPHPLVQERLFVLDPLAEIAPAWRHPQLDMTVAEMQRNRSASLPPERRSGVLGIVCLVTMFAFGAHAGAQSESPRVAEQASEDSALRPAEALERMQRAYRGAPIGERIEVVARSSGSVERSSLTLRLAPDAIRVDLDGLAALATREALTLAHVPSGRGLVTPALPDEALLDLLARLLPPLPLPQLVVLEQGAMATTLPPLCSELRWFSSTHVDDLLLLEGVGEECSASLAMDRTTWRLASATLRGRSEAGPISVEIRVEPFDPGDASVWALDAGAIEPIRSIADLAPREGDVQDGDSAPDLLLLTRNATPWRLSQARRENDASTAILLFRDDTSAVHAAHEAVAEVIADGAVALVAHVAVVLPASGVEPLERLESLTPDWGEDLLWTVSADTTLGRFAPDAVGALVVIDAAGVVRLVEPIENRASDSASLARRIVAACSAPE